MVFVVGVKRVLKVAGIVFSARREGNCLNCMKYCLEKLKEKGFSTILINAYDYNIKPCSHCNYECYADVIRGRKEECPVQDDVSEMYMKLRNADLLVFAIPCYGGHVPALYKAWNERVAHIPAITNSLKKFEDFQRAYLSKIGGFIVIGNLTAAGDMTLHEILCDFYNTPPPETILLQAREYGRISLKGDLIEVSAVKEKLDRFINILIKRTTEKYHK